MKNIKKEILVWVNLGGLVIIWIAVLYLSNLPLVINWEAIKKLPDVITIYLILSFIFTKWLWKWNIFHPWLVPYPNLNGTWDGILKSTWVNPETQKSPDPIPTILVIKQTFTSISCVMFTGESESYSIAAQINEDDDSGILRLSYNYTNRPEATVRSRSEIHDGAAILKIVTVPNCLLEGEYWTSRKTTGQMLLKFKTKEHYEGLLKK